MQSYVVVPQSCLTKPLTSAIAGHANEQSAVVPSKPVICSHHIHTDSPQPTTAERYCALAYVACSVQRRGAMAGWMNKSFLLLPCPVDPELRDPAA
jgi:hypothetical protein